jgi:hypothetical protein
MDLGHGFLMDARAHPGANFLIMMNPQLFVEMSKKEALMYLDKRSEIVQRKLDKAV